MHKQQKKESKETRQQSNITTDNKLLENFFFQVVWSGPKIGNYGRPKTDSEAYRARSMAKMQSWNALRSVTKCKNTRESLKNKISALRHRLTTRDNKEVEQTQNITHRVYNLRVVLKILVEMPHVLKKTQIKKMVTSLGLTQQFLNMADKIEARLLISEFEKFVWIPS